MTYRVITDGSYTEGRKLIVKDKLSYAVLYNVLGAEIKKIVTNDEDIIFAHTAKIFPTWVWAPDNLTEEKLEEIYQILLKEFAPIMEYRVNTKHEIAQYLVKRLQEDGYHDFAILTNIAAYECHAAVAPQKAVDGKLEKLSANDFDLAVRLIGEATVAIGDHVLSEEQCVDAAKEQLERQVLYVWRNAEGKAVSFCDRNEDDNYVKVSQVYTPTEERGKGYAAQMIYELCCEILEKGRIPMLYADADYRSSNRCYQKIGFELKGKIATVGKRRQNRA